MSTTQNEKAVSKLLSMADNVVIQNRVYQRALPSQQRQDSEYCRLDRSIKDLQETAEKCRKSAVDDAERGH